MAHIILTEFDIEVVAAVSYTASHIDDLYRQFPSADPSHVLGTLKLMDAAGYLSEGAGGYWVRL